MNEPKIIQCAVCGGNTYVTRACTHCFATVTHRVTFAQIKNDLAYAHRRLRAYEEVIHRSGLPIDLPLEKPLEMMRALDSLIGRAATHAYINGSELSAINFQRCLTTFIYSSADIILRTLNNEWKERTYDTEISFHLARIRVLTEVLACAAKCDLAQEIISGCKQSGHLYSLFPDQLPRGVRRRETNVSVAVDSSEKPYNKPCEGVV